MSTSTQGLDAIVIGGSAGALEALAVLLPALPADTAVAVAIVVHLPPTKPSRLAEVLGNKTRLPVKEVEDKEPVLPGTVYVAPPGYHVLVEKGRSFALSTDELVHYSRPAIDVLFESASEAYGDRLAGIILTGSNADGAQGLAAIGRRGGLAIVQSPESAMAATMPLAAIAAAHADRVLPVAGIAALLAALAGGARPTARGARTTEPR